MEPHPLGPSVWQVLDCHGPWTNDTPEEQASGQREPRTKPQRKRAWRRAIRLLIMTGACGSATMLADPDTLSTPRASATQPYYVATITSVIYYCMGHRGGESAILTSAGKDASAEFDMIHPPDVVEKYAPDAVIGTLGDGGEDDDDEVDDSSEGAYTMEDFAKHYKKGDVWVFLNGRVLNVSNVLSRHTGGELTIWAFADNDSMTEFNMIYLLNGDQRHAPDVSASCHGQGRCRYQFGCLERLLLAYGVNGK